MLVHARSIVATLFLQIDVLLHELTHCVHSEHDDNFNVLNSLLKMECASSRCRLLALQGHPAFSALT